MAPCPDYYTFMCVVVSGATWEYVGMQVDEKGENCIRLVPSKGQYFIQSQPMILLRSKPRFL